MSRSPLNVNISQNPLKLFSLNGLEQDAKDIILSTDTPEMDLSPLPKFTKYNHKLPQSDTITARSQIQSEKNLKNRRRRCLQDTLAGTASGDASADRSSSVDPKESSRGTGEDSANSNQTSAKKSEFNTSPNPFTEAFYDSIETFLNENDLYCVDEDDLRQRSLICNKLQTFLINSNNESVLKGLSEGNSLSPTRIPHKLSLNLKPSNSENSHSNSVSVAGIGSSSIFQRRGMSNSQPGSFKKSLTSFMPIRASFDLVDESATPLRLVKTALLKESDYPKSGMKSKFCVIPDISIHTSTTNIIDDTAENCLNREIEPSNLSIELNEQC